MNLSVLLNQIDFARQVTLGIISDLTESEAEVIPPGFPNSIRWNLGHILVDQAQWLYFLIPDKIELPAGYQELFQGGTRPQAWQTQPPSLAELREALEAQPAQLRAKFSERLEEPLLRPTELGMATIGEVIPRTIYHEGLHAGIIKTMLQVIRG
jgi:hypothetical protein